VQALTTDSTPRVDTVGYRWHRLQEFARILKPTTRILLKEHLKENNDWLRDIVELFER
jgi:ubiquinone/menaquinone biosynthesis C-methylase UbiE